MHWSAAVVVAGSSPETPRVLPFPGSHQLMLFLLEAGVMLLLAALLGRVADRLGFAPVVGELAAGLLLGPSVLGHLFPGVSAWLFPADPGQLHLLDAVGQLGVLLLVAVSSAQLDHGALRGLRGPAIKVSVFSAVLPFVLGAGVGLLVPATLWAGADRTVSVLFLATALSLSAVPVIARTLLDLRIMHRDVAQLTLVSGVVGDACAWLMLSVLTAAAASHAVAGGLLGRLAVLATLVIAVVILRPLVRRLSQRTTGSTALVAIAGGVLVFAAVSSLGGLEAVFGAFVAGLLVGELRRTHPRTFDALQTGMLAVLAPIFFATVGQRVDLAVVLRSDVLRVAVLVLLAAVVGKFAAAALATATSRLGRWETVALGAALNARGVVEVVVALIGLSAGIIGLELYSVIVLLALATSMMAPPVLRWAMRHLDESGAERQRRSQVPQLVPATEEAS